MKADAVNLGTQLKQKQTNKQKISKEIRADT